MNKLLFSCGRILTILSIVWLLVKIQANIDKLPKITFEIESSVIFLLSLAYVLVALVLVAYVTQLLLCRGEVFLPFKKVYIITGIPQVAKYLPGNVFHYLGQIALGRNAGIPAQWMILTFGLQAFILIFTSSALAVIGLSFDRTSFLWLVRILGTTRIILIIIIIAIFSIGLFLIMTFFPKIRTWLNQCLTACSPGRLSAAALLHTVIFFGYGIMISSLLRAFWQIETALQWYHFTWGFALAWVIGFVVPGAPGGLGIREIILFGLYSQELGTGVVIGLSILLRIITSLADLITFGVAFFLDRFRTDHPLFRHS